MPPDEYLQAIGRLLWNFSLLEWDVVYLIVKLNGDDWSKAKLEETSATIAKSFERSLEDAVSTLPPEFLERLRSVAKLYKRDILERNGLLHAHPYTAATGAQQLGGTDRLATLREWSLERLQSTAFQIANHQRQANALLHEYVHQSTPRAGL
jgi:hypothetical protein